jgi:antitoxin component YwqK of YwqJK toxin-antitoxin module
MKQLTAAILFFVSSLVASQEINRFDVDGNRHGIWKKNFEGTDQPRYEGQFAHGKETGEFRYYKLVKKRSRLSAIKQFSDDDNSAYVKFFTSFGKLISEGKMMGRVYVGEWIYYHKNSTRIMIRENFDNKGVLNGPRTIYYNNGNKAEESTYKDGKLEGFSKIYSENGVEIKTLIYENDELHGLAKYYTDDGELVAQGSYKRGKKTGLWKYYRDGELVGQNDFTYIPKYKKKQ